MKTQGKMTGLLIAAVLALSAPGVYADSGNGGNLAGGQTGPTCKTCSHKGQHEWKHAHWAKHGDHDKGDFFQKLNLTEDQKKQLEGIWQKQMEAKKATFEQIEVNGVALNKELTQPTLDMNKINELQGQLKTLQAQMVDNRLNSMLEIKKILTPEQFGKYLELHKHKFGDHEGWKKEGERHHSSKG